MAAPGGTITFLFTDIEGSTRLWEHHSSAMSGALARHDSIVRAAIERRGGHIFKTVGDAFCAAFSAATGALAAAFDLQRGITSEPWGDAAIVVRCALHCGTAEQRDGDYFGPTLNRVARLLAAAHGGQVLLSQAAAALTRESMPPECALIDLGTHRLRDLEREEHIFQLAHPDLRADFPPIKALRARHDNLPPERTAFIGRERERAELRELLLHPDTRLLTLTGAGGCGKTRLAVQVAGECIEDFSDGVCFVALAAITDPEFIAPAIMQALNLREGGDRAVKQVLSAYLRDKSLLLVLDNFEQVMEAAPLVGELVSGSHVRVITTSRAPLHLYGEREYPVPTLAIPKSADATELSLCPASRLFIERAQAADARFTVANENAQAIAEICRRLDGLPLAIELAAARVKLLSPQAMLNRLESRLDVLTGGARDLPERQRTMRGTIEWSHAMLDEAERKVFRRLSVFAGGLSLDAAEEICAIGEHEDVLSGVTSLLDKSLLHRNDAASDETRLQMLETIREHAIERLEESGELATMRERHAAWALRLAERARDQVHGPRQMAWLAICEREHDNFRAAMAWSVEREGANVLRLATALAPFWRLHCHLSEGHHWLTRGLTLAPGAPPSARAAALLWSGLLAIHAGYQEAARPLLEEASRMADAAGDAALKGRAFTALGWSAIEQGGLVEGRALCAAAVDLLRTTTDRWGLADALHFLGHACADDGGLESARPAWDESLRLGQEMGDLWSQALPLKDLGLIAARTGDYSSARELYENSLALLREIGDKWHVADTLLRLGELSLFTDDAASAINWCEEALALSREADNGAVIAEGLMRQAEAAEVLSDYGQARALIEEAVGIARDLSHDRLLAAALHNLAYVALHDGDAAGAARMLAECVPIHLALERDLETALDLAAFGSLALQRGNKMEAARLFGAAEALRGGADVMHNRFDRLEFVVGQDERIAAARAALGNEAFEQTWMSGASLTRFEALELVGRIAATATDQNAQGATA